MLHGGAVVAISLAYAGFLFAIAFYGDRRPRSGRQPLVYSLTLAVFCTSWGFFGVIGQAASFGWAAAPPLGSVLIMVPTYIGPFLALLLGWRFFAKLVRIGKRHKITSIADFISARYGKSQVLAALVAVIAVIGVIPYIALQLKSIAVTYQIITAGAAPGTQGPPWYDTALYVTLLMAVFAILFGTRHIDATERHQGMMLAIAFESGAKLLAFLLVGGFITYGMYGGFEDLAGRLAQAPELATMGPPDATSIYFVQALLSTVVMFCLPRQFHVAVVENSHPDDVRTARWLFPLYLIAISVFVWPVAVAGLLYFPPGSVDADTFMLTLPLAEDQPGLALLAFIGGFSAGTGMVIVATVAVSIMVCNDVVMPLLLRARRLALNERKDLSRLLLLIRRCSITLTLLFAYGYYRLTAEYVALASFGVLSFAAAAQVAPALVGGVYWRRGSRRGALAGMSTGFALWAYTLLIPTMARSGWVPAGLLEHGPLGLEWLRPTALFGLEGPDPLTHGVLWSLSVNIGCYLLLSLSGRRRLVERQQAAAFVDVPEDPSQVGASARRGSALVEDLQALAQRFIGTRAAAALFENYAAQRERPLQGGERAEAVLIDLVERRMAGVIGASSARVVLDSVLRGRDMQLDDVATIVGEASQVVQFNRGLLQATFESVSQGICVTDQELRVVAWNRRFVGFFDYLEEVVRVGLPVAELLRRKAERGEYDADGNALSPARRMAERFALLRLDRPYVIECTRPDGTVLEIRGQPTAGDGRVITYTDITAHKRAEAALRESEQNIRVYTDNVPALIIYVDRTLRFRFANRAYLEIWGLERDKIYGRTVAEVFSQAHYRQRLPYLEAALAGQRQDFEIELSIPGLGLRHASASYIPDRAADGTVVGLFALFHDVTERVRAERALQEAKAHLERRVEERTEALTALNEALERARQEAEQANRSKTRFLAAASHDLLQPLNAAGLFCSALAQRLSDAQSQDLVKHIGNALRSGEELLGELLDISKLDAGAMQPQINAFELGELLAELSAEFDVLARNKGLVLVAVPCRQVVVSDRQLVRRILQNFLSNAVRYTHRGRVLLGCRRVRGRLRIEVWDSGPGIREAERLRIFEEFHRLDHHDQQGEKCLGLGLAIADRVARILHHPIGLRSWPGRGSVFSVTVPRGIRAIASSAAAPAPPAQGLSGLRVLCVDNEPSILHGMLALLATWGCEAYAARDLAQAEAMLRDLGRVDVVIADYHLDAGVTGIALMDALRGCGEGTLPGVLVTADRSEAVAQAGRAAGYPCLYKPVKPAALRAVLARLQRDPSPA